MMVRSLSKPFDSLDPARQAGILCQDDQFQKFAALRSGLPDHKFNPTAAATYLREVCNVESRRDLNTNPKAAKHFHALRTSFDAWRGKIPQQR